MKAQHTGWRSALLWAAALALLSGVFALYLQPDLAFTLANAFWACF